MEISEWRKPFASSKQVLMSASLKKVIVSAYKKFSVDAKEQVYSFILSGCDFSHLQFHYQVMSSDDNTDFEDFQLKESAFKVREFFVMIIENEIIQLFSDKSLITYMIRLLKSFDAVSKDILVKIIAYEIRIMRLNNSYAIPLVNLLGEFDRRFSS
jgi:hypothetical protein